MLSFVDRDVVDRVARREFTDPIGWQYDLVLENGELYTLIATLVAYMNDDEQAVAVDLVPRVYEALREMQETMPYVSPELARGLRRELQRHAVLADVWYGTFARQNRVLCEYVDTARCVLPRPGQHLVGCTVALMYEALRRAQAVHEVQSA